MKDSIVERIDPRQPTSAIALVRSVLDTVKAPCLTCSFQMGGVVLLHMVRQVRPDIPVLFVDTAHHFSATITFRDELAERWNLNVITLRAEQPEIGLWQTNPDECCARHKVRPVFAALEAFDAWFTGLRREQAPTRARLAHVGPFTLPSGHVLTKVNPLATWTTEEVQAYVREHDLPLLPQYDAGYTSIGCEPCTRVPPDRANPRSGRWQGRKLECGIHLQPFRDGDDRKPARVGALSEHDLDSSRGPG